MIQPQDQKCLNVSVCAVVLGEKGGGGGRLEDRQMCGICNGRKKKKQTCGDKHKEIYNKLCISEKKKDLIWTFRMFQHTSSEEINR